MVQIKSAADRCRRFHLPSPRAWRFSLRGLLIATAFVSICLAMGATFTFTNFIVSALVMVYVSILESFDWLIRPQNRWKVAFVTAGLWTMLGSGFVIFGFKIAFVLIWNSQFGDAFEGMIYILALASPCYWLASRRWRRLTAYRRGNL
jgi:hypothetical protein